MQTTKELLDEIYQEALKENREEIKKELTNSTLLVIKDIPGEVRSIVDGLVELFTSPDNEEEK